MLLTVDVLGVWQVGVGIVGVLVAVGVAILADLHPPRPRESDDHAEVRRLAHELAQALLEQQHLTGDLERQLAAANYDLAMYRRGGMPQTGRHVESGNEGLRVVSDIRGSGFHQPLLVRTEELRGARDVQRKPYVRFAVVILVFAVVAEIALTLARLAA